MAQIPLNLNLTLITFATYGIHQLISRSILHLKFSCNEIMYRMMMREPKKNYLFIVCLFVCFVEITFSHFFYYWCVFVWVSLFLLFTVNVYATFCIYLQTVCVLFAWLWKILLIVSLLHICMDLKEMKLNSFGKIFQLFSRENDIKSEYVWILQFDIILLCVSFSSSVYVIPFDLLISPYHSIIIYNCIKSTYLWFQNNSTNKMCVKTRSN